MMRLLLWLILLFLSSSLNAQDTFKDRFDLGLLKIDQCDRNWVVAYKSVNFQHKEEKGNRFLSIEYAKRVSKEMSFTLIRTLIFPENIVDKKIDIGIETRGSSSHPLTIKLISYDDNESELETSIMQTKIASDWSNNIVSLREGKIAAIKVIISYKGDQDINQVVSFRSISVKSGRKDITSSIIKYPIDSTYNVFDKTYIKTLNRSESEFNTPISTIKDIKVIGLGEITHGTKNIGDSRSLFIKDLISQHNCKLVLLEIPFDLALLMNLYVTGQLDPSGKANLNKNMNLTFSGMDDFEELLEWIKNYNHSNLKPVRIFGIDNAAKSGNIDYPLMDFHLHLFGKEIMFPYLSMFMKTGMKETLDKIRLDQVVNKSLNKKDTEFYKYFISDYANQDNNINILKVWNIKRDENMFNRVRFLDSLYIDAGEKIVVLAHSWHLKKTPLITGLPSETMLGNYLDFYYKNSYFAINFTFGTGTFLQDNCTAISLTIDTIQKPRNQTLESYAYRTGVDFFYYPTNKLNSPPSQMLGISRFKFGSDYIDFGNVKKRYDGIVFLRNVTTQNSHNYNTFFAYDYYSKDRKKEYDELIKEMHDNSLGPRK